MTAVRLTNSLGVLLLRTTKAGVCMNVCGVFFDGSVGLSLADRQEKHRPGCQPKVNI